MTVEEIAIAALKDILESADSIGAENIAWIASDALIEIERARYLGGG